MPLFSTILLSLFVGKIPALPKIKALCLHLTHPIILPAFKLTKILLLSGVHKFICVTMIISYFTSNWYPTAN